MVTELTGLPVTNASLLDEATAAAEAMAMARRLDEGRQRTASSSTTTPIRRRSPCCATRAEPIGIDVVVGDVDELDDGCFGALFSLPTSTGAVVDWRAAIERVHAAGGLAIVATDLLACVLATPPGQLGADIAVGSAQRFGVPMMFGGPHAAFIAAHEPAARALPGRIVGVSTDTAGRPALRLALQTREQHIRREKATSNICTAQVLLANIAGFYAAYHGPAGLRRIAERTHRMASIAADALRAAGLSLRHDTWFDTITVDGVDADAVARRGPRRRHRLCGRSTTTSVGCRSTRRPRSTSSPGAVAAFGAVARPRAASTRRPTGCRRRPAATDEFLTQSVFNRYHTEHEMLRYLRRLADADLALDRTMIPLGSCTMKLNATTEMASITWPEFAGLHPFAPLDESIGLRAADRRARGAGWPRSPATTRSACSPTPAARASSPGCSPSAPTTARSGDDDRTVCLIPSSAHGTNAASAVMAGLDVVVVATDDQRQRRRRRPARQARRRSATRLAGIMLTYPSTHGVFEEAIGEICDAVHDAGGQVYVDGANLNALVGAGPAGCTSAPTSATSTCTRRSASPTAAAVPASDRSPCARTSPRSCPAIRSAPASSPSVRCRRRAFGSAGILPIPWAYIALMGPDGLARATAVAIASANYIATRLDEHYPVLYTGAKGRVGHECILDLRAITRATGVTVDDVAKRLMDYGFHAPTLSFPVAGTLMVEPTESETLGRARPLLRRDDRDPRGDRPGRRRRVAARAEPAAPRPAHRRGAARRRGTARTPASSGAYPLRSLRVGKYFPPVSRIDAASGDRNLVCSCEPLEAYATSLA